MSNLLGLICKGCGIDVGMHPINQDGSITNFGWSCQLDTDGDIRQGVRS